ncbi:MAG: roadblock/LC7 domain-containing protein [Chloroflexota bacterium]
MSSIYRITILENELRQLLTRMPSIRDTVIVSSDGFVVAACSEEDLTGQEANSPQIAAMTAAIIGLSEQTLMRLAQGHISRLLIEGDDGAIIVLPVKGASVALAVLIGKDAKTGLIMHEIGKTADALGDLLANYG